MKTYTLDYKKGSLYLLYHKDYFLEIFEVLWPATAMTNMKIMGYVVKQGGDDSKFYETMYTAGNWTYGSCVEINERKTKRKVIRLLFGVV